MKKNIEVLGGGIKCDNPKCDYEKDNVRMDQYAHWLNKPCPKCGENLLTNEDYDKIQILLNLANLFNEMEVDPTDDTVATMEVDIHNNEFTITDIETPYDQEKIDKKISGRKDDPSSNQ